MSSLSVTRGACDGFETVVVDTGLLSLCLIPELGGKINSLRDLRTGREWLWRNPRQPYQRPPAGSDYVAVADTGGWDECLPTVAPCAYPAAPWAGTSLPDHGELWSQTPVLAVGMGADTVSLNTRWQGAALPYTFERQVQATAGSASLRVDYTIANHGPAPLQFIWSMHPLLAIEPGMQLRLPPEASFNRWSSVPEGSGGRERLALSLKSGRTRSCDAARPDGGGGA